MSRYLTICRWCGAIFPAERKTRTTCGDLCRQSLCRCETVADDWRSLYVPGKQPIFAEQRWLAKWVGRLSEPTPMQLWWRERLKERKRKKQERIAKGDKRYKVNQQATSAA